MTAATVEGIRQAEWQAEQLAELGPRLGVRAVDDISHEPPPPLLDGKLDPEKHTIVFGPGDIGKGCWTSACVGQLANAGEVVLILDYEDNPREWARRIHGLRGHAANIYHVSPTASTWQGQQGSLWDHAPEIRKTVDALGVTFIVIDSIVVACGAADPMDPATAGQYAAALTYIGKPALSLAHVTKLHDSRYPFGSVFWHNLARVTWSMSRGYGGAVLTNRKANNYRNQGRYVVTFDWWEDVLRNVNEQPYTAHLGDLIADVLADGPASATDITKALDDGREDGEEPVKVDSVTKALKRGLNADPKRFTVTGTGKSALWRNAS